MWPSATRNWSELAKQKQAAREAAIDSAGPGPWGGNEGYLGATAREIVERISKGEWTAADVLEAYIARATLAHQRVNCLTEVMFADARAEARALDKEFAATGRVRGPLHGVPVSFKDPFDVNGYDTSMGFTSLTNSPAAEDGQVVRLVRAAGGVPFVKTNISQMMFFFECQNPLWGRTLNPRSAEHTSGGSSGGEAALLAMDGCALGWGTDIGGSLRIPASFCGVYSLKPGWCRISSEGVKGTFSGVESIRCVVGPMGRSVDDVEIAARLVIGKQGADYDPAPLPYREVVLPKKLRFGYYTSDNYVKASPPCRRAVVETIEALRRQGHECVEFRVPAAPRAVEIYLSLLAADGYKTLSKHLGNDPVEEGISVIFMGPRIWRCARSVVGWAVKTFFGDHVFAGSLHASRPRGVADYHALVVERDQYARMFYAEVWDKLGLDGIICPVLALPGLPHGACKFLGPLAAQCLLYNFVDSPVGTVPVTHVQAHLDKETTEWTNQRVGSGHGSPIVEGMLYEGLGGMKFYDSTKMEGLPVGVQVIGRKWEEEKVIEMMKVVDGALGDRGFGPGSWQPGV